jgi:predicted nucleotidyltransferase component of viral defense system
VTGPVARSTLAGLVFLDLRAMARRENRLTDEMLILYAHEAFLRRLAVSAHGEDFVLKGGVLLAALGNRRPTRDLDFHARAIAGDVENVTRVVQKIAAIVVDDGVVFDVSSAAGQVIRENEQYEGVRVKMDAAIHTARPVWSSMSTSATRSFRGRAESPCP